MPASTVKDYFSILEDTLLGNYLWPWGSSERKKARPKFYFFDTGVVRAIQGRLCDAPSPVDRGFLFESWCVRDRAADRDRKRLGPSQTHQAVDDSGSSESAA